MQRGISKQQHRLLALLATPIGARKPGAWPIRELREVFMPNGDSGLSEVKAIEQAEHSTRRALRALKARGYVEDWDSQFEPRAVGNQVRWVEAKEHVPGRTERMLGITLTPAGWEVLRQ